MLSSDVRPIHRASRLNGKRFRCTLRCGTAIATFGDPARMAAILTRDHALVLRRARLTVARRETK